MTKIDLEDKYIEFIKSTISKVLPNVDVYIFGSRVQGTSTKFSDVDIALDGDFETSNLLRLKAVFQDSTFPYKVDIVDLKSLDENFKNIIKNDLYKIND